MNWRIFHKKTTSSTNIDARGGKPGDVFSADYQSAGRGRLDHKWLSAAGVNLMMSAVLDVSGLDPDRVSTLPLAVGLGVVRGVAAFVRGEDVRLKWPNDVLIGRRKIAGILCERNGDAVIVGIGVNVRKQVFPPEIADKAISIAEAARDVPSLEMVRDAVLEELAEVYLRWKEKGFVSLFSQIREIDFLKGRVLSVRQTDDDKEPVRGISGGILEDGSLDVGGVKVFAGEAHVEKTGEE